MELLETWSSRSRSRRSLEFISSHKDPFAVMANGSLLSRHFMSNKEQKTEERTNNTNFREVLAIFSRVIYDEKKLIIGPFLGNYFDNKSVSI